MVGQLVSSTLMGITSPFSPLSSCSFHHTEFFILAEFGAVGRHSHGNCICFTLLLKQVNREKAPLPLTFFTHPIQMCLKRGFLGLEKKLGTYKPLTPSADDTQKVQSPHLACVFDAFPVIPIEILYHKFTISTKNLVIVVPTSGSYLLSYS